MRKKLLIALLLGSALGSASAEDALSEQKAISAQQTTQASSNQGGLQQYQVTQQTVALPIQLDASVEAVNRATISSQTSGRIMQINFDVDDYVEKGSVLIRIAGKQQRAKVAVAEAGELEAQAAYIAARNEFQRIQDVYQRKLVSKSDLDKAEAALKSSKERLSAATARLHDASAALKYTKVLAPYSGVVVERFVEVGELAKVGQPLMTGLSLAQLRISANVSQQHAIMLRQLKTLQVLVGKQVLTASNVRVSPQADPRHHSFIVRADLPKNSQNIYPGMFVKVQFDGPVQSRILIPQQAVANRSELRAVYLLRDPNQIVLRQVRLGETWDGKVEVLAGLEAGDAIAMNPQQALLHLKTQ